MSTHVRSSTSILMDPKCSVIKEQHCTSQFRRFSTYRRIAEVQIFEKTYLIVIKDETGLKFKMNDSTLFLIGSYAQKLVASYYKMGR